MDTPHGADLKVIVSAATTNAGLAVIRSLGGHGLRITGVDKVKLPFGLHSHYSAAYRVHPQPGSMDFEKGVLQLLFEITPDVMLPMSTAMVGMLAACRQRLPGDTGLLIPEYDAFVKTFDKVRTVQLCLGLNIDCPRLLTKAEALEMLACPGGAKTVVVKPRMDIGAALGVEYARCPLELEKAVRHRDERYGERFLQEYIPGAVDCMRTVLLLFDEQSRLAARFTTRKIRQWPTSGGITAMSVSTDEPELVEYVLPIFTALGWRGPAEVELKEDPRDGKLKVIEINPRFPSYIGFTLSCGLNMPLMACMLAVGRNDGIRRCPSYATGRKYLAPSRFMRSVAADVRRSRAKLRTVGDALRDLRGPLRLNPGAITDPLPRLGKLLKEFRETFGPESQ